MGAFFDFILNQNPIMIGVAIYLIMEIRALKASINNHIPSQISKLEADLKHEIKRVEEQGHVERRRIEDQGQIERKRIENKLDQIITHLIDKK